MENFKPCYVWPNEHIPFRVFYQDINIRIFIIENLGHNFEVFKSYKAKKSDFFFVFVGCHFHDQLVREASEMINFLHLIKENFFILYNDNREKLIFEKYDFKGEIINQNSFLDFNDVMKPLQVEKKYDSIYVARLIDLKRHKLASEVTNLALVAGPLHGGQESTYIPNHTYRNELPLTPSEVAYKINESYCGLILSDKEGASFVSSEYLLCGVPVVSTVSEGGRDFWYDEYNSIVVEPKTKNVKEAVDFFKNNPRDPITIRTRHIDLSIKQRNMFIAAFENMLKIQKIDYINATKFFNANFFHKLRTISNAHQFYLK